MLKDINNSKGLLVSLLTITCIPLIITSIIMYNVCSSALYNSNTEKKQRELSVISETINRDMHRVSGTAYQLAENYIRYYSKAKNPYNLPFSQLQIASSATVLAKSLNPNIYSIYAVHPAADTAIIDTAISKFSAMTDLDWYKGISTHNSNLDYQSFWIHARKVDGKLFSTYVYPFLIPDYANIGYIVINIDASTLFENFFDHYSDEMVIVCDSDSIIYSNLQINGLSPQKIFDSEEIKIENNKFPIAKYTDHTTNYTYTIAIDTEIILSSIRMVQISTVIIFIIFSLILIPLSFTFSKKIYKPLWELVHYVSPDLDSKENEGGNPLHIITTQFDTLKSASSQFKRKNFFRQLLREEFLVVSSDESMINSFKDYKKYSSFAVCVFESYSARSRSLISSISAAAATCSPDNVEYEIIDITDSMAAAVFFTVNKDADLAFYSELLTNIVDSVNSGENMRVFACMSPPIHSFDEFHNSFLAVLASQKNKIYADNENLIVADISDNHQERTPAYLLELVDNITASIKNRNSESTSVAIETLFNYIRNDKPPAEIVLRHLQILDYYVLNLPLALGFSDSELYYKDLDDIHLGFDKCKTTYDYEQYFLALINYVIKCLNFRQSKNHNALIENIKEYIQENIADDTSQEKVSSVYGITPQYLSTLFKKSTGENFIDYVIKTRIETAKHLLRTTDLPVSQISLMVGYVNNKSFYSIFKKITGFTPISYRKHTKGFNAQSDEENQ